MVVTVTEENFSTILNEGTPVVLDFWAEWCGPCRMVGPIIEELAAEYEGRVIIGKVDVDENTETAIRYGIRNIPTILYFKDGQIVDKQVGAFPKAMYIEKIEQLLN